MSLLLNKRSLNKLLNENVLKSSNILSNENKIAKEIIIDKIKKAKIGGNLAPIYLMYFLHNCFCYNLKLSGFRYLQKYIETKTRNFDIDYVYATFFKDPNEVRNIILYFLETFEVEFRTKTSTTDDNRSFELILSSLDFTSPYYYLIADDNRNDEFALNLYRKYLMDVNVFYDRFYFIQNINFLIFLTYYTFKKINRRLPDELEIKVDTNKISLGFLGSKYPQQPDFDNFVKSNNFLFKINGNIIKSNLNQDIGSINTEKIGLTRKEMYTCKFDIFPEYYLKPLSSKKYEIKIGGIKRYTLSLVKEMITFIEKDSEKEITFTGNNFKMSDDNINSDNINSDIIFLFAIALYLKTK